MKLRAIQLVFAISLMPAVVWANVSRRDVGDEVEKTTKSVAAQPTVTVSLCVLSANVSVQGWERNEVLAESLEGALIQMRLDAGADASAPATKIEVYVVDKGDTRRGEYRCQASTDLELKVPHGATVQIQSRDGSITIADVATAYAGSQNGDVDLERVTQVVEVGTIGGNISIRDSKGRMDLNSAGGSVSAENVRPGDAADQFEATTVSGEIELNQVTHSLLNLRTTTGNMLMSGPLTSGGRYGISTMSGNVTLALPADASFQLNAKISSGGDIITDFPLTLLSQSVSASKAVRTPRSPRPPRTGSAAEGVPTAPDAPPPPGPVSPQTPTPGKPAPAAPVVVVVKSDPKVSIVTPTATVKVKPTTTTTTTATTTVDTHIRLSPIIISPHALRRVSAICGTGDATISVASFSGTLHLQKN